MKRNLDLATQSFAISHGRQPENEIELLDYVESVEKIEANTRELVKETIDLMLRRLGSDGPNGRGLDVTAIGMAGHVLYRCIEVLISKPMPELFANEPDAAARMMALWRSMQIVDTRLHERHLQTIRLMCQLMKMPGVMELYESTLKMYYDLNASEKTNEIIEKAKGEDIQPNQDG